MNKRPRAIAPAKYEPADVGAIQAVYAGKAEPHQQQRALEWIMENACGIKEISYRSPDEGGYADTAFAEGRRFVGQQIAKLITTPAKLK